MKKKKKKENEKPFLHEWRKCQIFLFSFTLSLSLSKRFWYNNMVPEKLRLDQGHFGRELNKWKTSGTFANNRTVALMQYNTESTQTSTAVYQAKNTIRRGWGALLVWAGWPHLAPRQRSLVMIVFVL